MTSLEQMTPAVKTWLKGTAGTPYGVEEGVRRVMARVPQTKQRSRWWPPSTIQSIGIRSHITAEPATSSHRVAWPARVSRPVMARPVLRPATAILTVALAVTLGGTLLVVPPLSPDPGAADAALPPVTQPAGNGVMTYARDGDIFVGDPTTGDETLIVGGPDDDSSPRFSPDGTRIAFLRGDPTLYDARLVVVGMDGSEPHDVTPAGWPMEFAWTPDGSALLVNEELAELPSVGGVLKLYEVAGTSDPRTLVPPLPFFPGGPYFDDSGPVAPMVRPPDGDLILSGDYHALDVFSRDLQERTTLAAGALEPYEPYGISWPAWSPDGSMIAFEVDRVEDRNAWTGSLGTFVLNADGSGLRRIGTGEGIGASWSPDGSRIAVGRVRESDRAGATLAAGAVVVIIDIATGAEQELEATRVEGKAEMGRGWLHEGWSWSPDGHSMVMLERHGTRPLVIDVETGEASELPWETDSLPSWQRVTIR